MYQRYVKRCGDFALSLIGVIVLMPVFLLLSLWVKLDSKGPVLFLQKRIGKDKSFFIFLNFAQCTQIHPKTCPRTFCKIPMHKLRARGAFCAKPV